MKVNLLKNGRVNVEMTRHQFDKVFLNAMSNHAQVHPMMAKNIYGLIERLEHSLADQVEAADATRGVTL